MGGYQLAVFGCLIAKVVNASVDQRAVQTAQPAPLLLLPNRKSQICRIVVARPRPCGPQQGSSEFTRSKMEQLAPGGARANRDHQR